MQIVRIGRICGNADPTDGRRRHRGLTGAHEEKPVRDLTAADLPL
jgi:hypothetical protein